MADKMPEIYCAIQIVIPDREKLSSALMACTEAGIAVSKAHEPKFDTVAVIDLYKIDYKKAWYLNDILGEMFETASDKLPQIKEIARQLDAKICIDISFCQYGTYPALEITGDNMAYIRMLEADISIDPY